MDEFSVALLSKLLQTSIKLCGDNDKARHNAVRAVGNLLRYLPQHVLGNCCRQHEVLLTYRHQGRGTMVIRAAALDFELEKV